MNSSRKSLYSINDWEKELNRVNSNFFNLIKEEKPHYTTIIEILNILYFIGRDEELLSLLEKIKVNINTLEDFIPYYHFFLNLITVGSKEPNVILKEIEKFQKTSEKLPTILQEGLYWLKLEVSHKITLKEKESIDIEQVLEKITYPWWYWHILYIQVDVLFRKGTYTEIQELFRKMENYIKSYQLDIVWSKYYSILGNYLSRSGMLIESIESFEKGIEKAKVLKSENILTILYNNLGTAYLELGNFSKAEKIYQKSLNLQSQKFQRSVILNNIGYCNYCKGDFKKSFDSYSQAETLLKNIKSKKATRTLGYIQLGFGLHKSREGQIIDAKKHFQKALEIFKEHNEIHGEIYTHGMAARVFLDVQKFEIADKHFKSFLRKVEQIKSYENYFSFYCLFIQFLLSKNDKEDKKLIEKHLNNLKSISSRNKNNMIIQNWYKYIQANLEEKQLNLRTAEKKLKSVIDNSQKFETCELTLRSIISLSEVLMRKYTILKEDALLDEIFYYLSLANKIITLNPIFPMNVYIKIYLAMINSQKRKWKEVDKLLVECRQILELSRTKTDHYFYDLLNQIEGQKVIFGDLSKGLIHAFQLGIGKFFSKERFNENEIGIIMWKLIDIGPSIILKSVPEELIPKEQLDVLGILMGSLLTTFLGQGEKYHEGVYGPLPVPTLNVNEQVFCQVNARIVKDNSQTDIRLENRNYVILAVLYSGNKDIDRLMLKNTLENWWKTITDLSLDNTKNYAKLKQMIIENVSKIE